MNRQQRTTLELFLVLLAAIGLFAAWIVVLEMETVHVWAVGATLAALLAVASMIMRRR